MTAEPTRILLVDNEVDAREWLAELLRQQSFEVQTAENSSQCLQKVSEASGNYDVIVMDVVLGKGPNGVETMKEVKKRYPIIETIIITGFGDKFGMEAVRAGAYRYVTKPINNEEIVVYIERAAEKRKLLSEISRAEIYETFTMLRRGLNLEVILDGIVETLYGLFKLDTCTITLFDSDLTRFEVAAERGLGTKFTRQMSAVPEDYKKVFEHERPLEVTDLDARPDWKACLWRQDLKSLTLLPLKDKMGVWLGVITMGRLQCTAPASEQEIRLLMGLANQATMAIENARLFEQTKKEAALLASFFDAALDIVDPVHVEELLRKTIEVACKILQVSGGTVYLFTPDGRKLIVKASFGTPLIAKGIVVERDSGVVGEVIKRNKPFSIAGYSKWSGRQEQFEKLALQAVMGVPIIYSNQLLGVLALHHTDPDRVFTVEQEDYFVRFGRHAGAGLVKAQMLEEQKKSGELIEALVSEFGANQTFRGEQWLLEKILAVVREHWPQGFCEIFLTKKYTNELYVKATDFPVKKVPTTPIKLGETNGVIGEVAATRKAKVVFDVREEENYAPALKETRSEIAVPLVCENNLIGVLNIESAEIGAFNERDERILTRIATAIAVRVNQFQQDKEARRQMKQSLAMFKFNRGVNAAKTLQEKLNLVAKKVLSGSNGDFCLVMLPTRDGHNLRVRAAETVRHRVTWSGVIDKLCRLLEIPEMPEGLLAGPKLFTAADPLGTQIIREIIKRAKLKQQLKSVLLIPLKEGPTFVGLCILGEVAGGNGKAFTDQSIRSAVMFADNAAPWIYQARLMELEQQRNQVFKDLTTIGNMVTSTLDKRKVFDLIVDSCRSLLNAEVCTIFQVTRAGFISLESSSGSPEGTADPGLKLPLWDGKEPNTSGFTGYLAVKGEIFNEYGKKLDHPAIKSHGPHPHLPSLYCKSLLGVPLKKKTAAGKDEVIGLIKVENKKDQTDRVDRTHGFTREDVLVASTLASFAVTAIQNAEHFAFATALEHVAREVNSSIVDYNGVLERVLVQLRQLIPFTSASIQLRDGNMLKVKACHGFSKSDKEKVLKLTFPLIPTFPNERVLRKKEPYRIDDLRSTRFEHFWKDKMYCGGHVRSWLGIPLMRGGEVIGMLAMESDERSFYTSTDEDRAEAFASQVVPAIVNAELYKGAESLTKITHKLSKQVDRPSVLQKIVDSAIDKNSIIGADKAVIYGYDSEDERFDSPAVHAGGLLDPEASNPPFLKNSVVYRCTKLKRPYRQPDVANCKLLNGNFTRREKIVSAAVFPLLVDRELVGLMFINYLEHHYFTGQEIAVMKLFAQQAAIAIKKARQYEKLEQRMANAVAMARVGRLASTLAHDVNTPALSIRLDVDSLRQDIQDSDSMKILDDIDFSAQQIAQVVPNNLPTNDDPESVNLMSVVDRIRQRRKDKLTALNVSIQTHLDDVPNVLMTNQWMDWIFERMISNALRFISGGGTITFSGKVSGKRVLLEVIDSGPGVPPHVRDQLYVGKVIDRGSSGGGTSLLIIKSVLSDFNGNISYPEKDERGNVFTISLSPWTKGGEDQ